MAIFGGKGKGGTGDAAPESGEGPLHGGFKPENARKFFERAENVHQTLNYEYAAQLWLNGLAQDPSSYEGFQGFVRSIQALVAEKDKKASGRDIAKGLQGQGPVRKFQDALLAWGLRVNDAGLTLKAAEAAGALGAEVQRTTTDLGRLALAQARADKKSRKDTFVRLMDAFEKAGAFPLAVEAGDEARKLDAADGDLAKRVQQMAAQSTISSGGYDDTGKEGGFRKNIRDAGKQAELEGADSISKSDDVKERLLLAAKADYERRPEDPGAIDKYGRALVDRGRNPDVLQAISLYTRAFEATGQFRFREKAGELGLQQKRRSIAAMEQKLRAAPDNAELKQRLDSAVADLRRDELSELRLQVKNYPTELKRKYDLGRVLAASGDHNAAIEQFQLAQDDPKIRLSVLRSLGLSFRALGGWEDAAIDTFRRAMEMVVDDGGDLALELRYELMCALQDKGRADRDIDALDEADRLAAQIAMKKFSYRDVQERRKAIKDHLGELRR